MKSIRTLVLCTFLSPIAVALASTAGPETITFLSGDEIRITADLYAPHTDEFTPFIVLFHQAYWSRGEYREIAPRLNDLGFNCMAVDQRSGGSVNGVENETVKRAEEAGKGTGYIDALPDLEAALVYAREHYGKGEIIAWGSSYSASLALRIAGDRPELVDGVLAFAPGEYFADQGKPDDWVEEAAGKIHVPAFITSARKETGQWADIFAAIPSEEKVSFVSVTEGNHGSRALWKQFDDSEAYWKAVSSFLKKYTTAPTAP
jgi:dienelactone hydrolase